MISTDVKEDIEEELDNSERHVVTKHAICPPNQPGTLVIADCGALFRARGQSVPIGTAGICAACRKSMSRHCAQCGEPI